MNTQGWARHDEPAVLAAAAAAGTTFIQRLSGVGAPVDGVTGTGLLNKGDEYLNTTNGQKYTNVGTSAATAFQAIAQL